MKKPLSIPVYLTLILTIGALSIFLLLDVSYLGWQGDDFYYLHLYRNYGVVLGMLLLSITTGGRVLDGALSMLRLDLLGSEPLPHHTFSILIHILTGIALGWLCLLLLKKHKTRFAALAALLFWIFPTGLTILFFVTATGNRQAVLLVVLALVFYTRFLVTRRKGWPWLILSLLSYGASLLSYDIAGGWAIVFPCLALLIRRREENKWHVLRQSAIEGIAFMLVLSPILLSRFVLLKTHASQLVVGNIPSKVAQALWINLVQVWPFVANELRLAGMLPWLAAAMAVVALLIFGIVHGLGAHKLIGPTRESTEPGLGFIEMLAFGLLLLVMGYAPTLVTSYTPSLPVGTGSRIDYLSSTGATLVLVSAVFLLPRLLKLPHKIGMVLTAGLLVIPISLGVAYTHKVRQDYIESNRVLGAIRQGIRQNLPALRPYSFVLLVMENQPRVIGVAGAEPGAFAFNHELQMIYGDSTLQGDTLFDDHLVTGPIARYYDLFELRDSSTVIQFTRDAMLPRNRDVIDYSRLVILKYHGGQVSVLNHFDPAEAEGYNAQFDAPCRVYTNWENILDQPVTSEFSDSNSLWTPLPAGLRDQGQQDGLPVLTPGFIGAYGPTSTEYRTNTCGLRDDEIDFSAQEHILFLGDSSTFGLNLDHADTYPEVVEYLAKANGCKLQSINAAAPGMGSARAYNVLSDLLIRTRLAPSLVVVGVSVNTPRADAYYLTRGEDRPIVEAGQPKPGGGALSHQIDLGTDPLGISTSTWFDFTTEFVKRATGITTKPAPSDRVLDEFDLLPWNQMTCGRPADFADPAEWSPTLDYLGRIQQLAAEHGAKTIILYIPRDAQEIWDGTSPIATLLRDYSAQQRATFVDGLQVYLAELQAQGFHSDDTELPADFYSLPGDFGHPGPGAARLLGEAVYNAYIVR